MPSVTILWTPTPSSDPSSRNDLGLVFGYHSVTEMAKTFKGFGKAIDRGRQLFSSLRRFIAAGACCAKQNMDLIPAELTALTSGSKLDPFISAVERAQLKAEADKLANGVFDDKANAFVEDRIEFAKRTRQAQISHLELRPEMKQQLKAVGSDALPAWLDQQVRTLDGQKILASHILRIYPDAPPSDMFLCGSAPCESRLSFRERSRARGSLLQLAVRASGFQSTRPH